MPEVGLCFCFFSFLCEMYAHMHDRTFVVCSFVCFLFFFSVGFEVVFTSRKPLFYAYIKWKIQ